MGVFGQLIDTVFNSEFAKIALVKCLLTSDCMDIFSAVCAFYM